MEIRNYGLNSPQVDKTAGDKEIKKELSVDDFLQIMAAEIKNQMPFDGGDGGGSGNAGYLAQMAQFTTLEQLSTIADRINILSLMNQQQYTFGLIGKQVTVIGDAGEVTGIVDKVKFENGYAVIQINDKTYHLGSIIEVSNPKDDE